MAFALHFGPLGPSTVHLCIDMQTLFAERTDWHVPWLERVLPAVVRLAEARRERSVFTRFVPPDRPEDAVGAWRRYYEHWRNMTASNSILGWSNWCRRWQTLRSQTSSSTRPIIRLSKHEAFLRTLGRLKPGALVISGGETDVCVLAAVMDAVDAGYTVVLAEDALCSVSDESHDAMLRHFSSRFSQQIEIASTELILAAWNVQ
jgi:nicotinamidase-related amidase